MHFGMVIDRNPLEHRVPLSPYGVQELTTHGHKVTVERGTGALARFTDEDYLDSGAEIIYNTEEAWMRPDVLVRIKPPAEQEIGMMRSGQVFMSYVELPFLPAGTRKAYTENSVSLLAFEEMRDQLGRWPMLAPLSMICGRMIPQIAARYLETFEGGRGKLLYGATGVAPCNVAVIGAGTLGLTACQMFQALGTRVTVLDTNMDALEHIERDFFGHGFVTTLYSDTGNISRVVRGSDVVVTAIHCPAGVCPKLIRREHLATMAPRAVIIDASITQGGAVETSRPTTLKDPTFIVDDIVHYCVPNITAAVARTASRAVSSALSPYLLRFAEQPLEDAIAAYREFDSGMVVINGKLRHKYEDIA
jgi:alanine dehydrogenase